MSVRDKLKKLKADWKDADSEGGDFERLPKGDYTGNIYDIELTESSNENPMIKLQIAVDSPGFEGRYVWDNIVLTDRAVPMAKQKLAKLGLDVDDFDITEIEDHIEELRGAEVSFRLSYKANADDPDADPWPRLRYRSTDGEAKPSSKPGGKKSKGKKKGKKKAKSRRF